MFNNSDIVKLILRLFVGVMILFHGVHKLIHGIGGVKNLTVNAGLPEFVAYGVYVGEVVVPIFLILGLYARVASVFLTINMSMAIFLAYGQNLFSLGKSGAPVSELALFYLVVSIAIFLLGTGKYGVNSK